MVDPRTPVLIGAAQWTNRKGPFEGPRTMLARVAQAAAADAGIGKKRLAETDLIGVVGFTVDAPNVRRLPTPRMSDPPAALAEDIGAQPRRGVYSHMGGNTPQALVNWAAEEIAEGRADLAVLAGAEFLSGLMKSIRAGEDLTRYGGGPETKAERFGDGRDGSSAYEAAHGLSYPVNVYPMFENALRAERGQSLKDHAAAMGALFAPFSAVAAKNPYAWFPKARSAEELVTTGPDNRMVGFPYPKYLNAIIQVDQAAAVILCSAARADALGVAPERRVYLHGCSDLNEKWNLLDRVNYHTAPAIGRAARTAFAMAGKTPADMAFFDIYSCFPVAVQIACAEIGIADNDPRGLTLTGGLPYFGGPGNNYSMHAIAEAVARCRADREAFGLITANGWYLTKHAMGIYSGVPTEGRWSRVDPAADQAAIDASPGPEIVEAPKGAATIETYTVVHDRDAYRMGIVIGRDREGRRFAAHTPSDAATLQDLEACEGVGRTGQVRPADDGKTNLFVPD